MSSQHFIHQSSAIEWISREQGLPSHQIHNVMVAKDKIWLATPNGLAIFDGEQIQVFDQKNNLLTHGIRSLTKDNSHVFICSDRGVDKLNRTSMNINTKVSTVDQGLGWCQAIKKISKNEYLLACAKGLRRWNTSDNKLSVLGSPLDNEFIVNIVGFDKGQALIQGNQSGVWLFSRNKLLPFVLHELLEYGNILSIFQQKEYAWLTTETHIFRLDTDFHILESIELPRKLKTVKAIYQTRSNQILIADEKKLVVVSNHQHCWKISHTLHDDLLVNDIGQDNYGNIWVATDFNGLIKVPIIDQYIKSYHTTRSNSILSIRPSFSLSNQHLQQGVSKCLLIGGTSFSFYLPKQSPSKAREITALRDVACWDLVQSNENCFWAATSNGLLRFASISQTEVDCFRDDNVGAGRCIYINQNELLYGSVSGLFIFDMANGSFQPVLDSNNCTVGYVYSIKENSKDSLYVTTLGNGLWQYNTKSKKINEVHTSLNIKNVYDLDIDQLGRVIIAADNKLWLIEGEVERLIMQVSLSVAAWCCRWYSEKQIALGTSNGLQIFDLENEEVSFIVDNFPRRRYWEFTTSRSLLRDSVDNFWCGLNEGLQLVKLREMEEIIPPPIPEIKNVKSNREFNRNRGKLSIEEGNWSIQVEIGSSWLWQESSLKYRYRLIGLVPEWRTLDGAHIEFTTLPLGEYLLEVSVSNNLAVSSKSYMLLMISVEAKSWFSHLRLLLLNSLKRLSSKYRMLRHLIRNQQGYNEMERLVLHRTQELSKANKELKYLNHSLRKLSTKDPLTGLYNRRYFFEQLDGEIKRAMRDELPLTVVMIDIDFFKTYNDNYGHLAGDICLKKVADILQSKFYRSGELIARFGGEEFIALMHNTDRTNALSLVQHCIEAVSNLKIEHAHSDCSEYLTISAGLCTQIPHYRPGKDSWLDYRQLIIRQADKALYQAKEKGRNRVETSN
jgi:diguanylate cyclase (GGDEF)-like protein